MVLSRETLESKAKETSEMLDKTREDLISKQKGRDKLNSYLDAHMSRMELSKEVTNYINNTA